MNFTYVSVHLLWCNGISWQYLVDIIGCGLKPIKNPGSIWKDTIPSSLETRNLSSMRWDVNDTIEDLSPGAFAILGQC